MTPRILQFQESQDSRGNLTFLQCLTHIPFEIRRIGCMYGEIKSNQSDESTMAHLNLGLIAYWIVNTIRYQLKAKKINHDWQEIIRIASTQKLVTTEIKVIFENTIEKKMFRAKAKTLRNLFSLKL